MFKGVELMFKDAELMFTGVEHKFPNVLVTFSFKRKKFIAYP